MSYTMFFLNFLSWLPLPVDSSDQRERVIATER